MKILPSLLVATSLLTACSPSEYFFGSDVDEQTVPSKTYPLYLTTMTHMEGGWLDDKDEDLFLMHVDQLHYGMDLAEEYDAILTIATAPSPRRTWY